MLPPTPSQTIGPFFAVGLCWADGPEVVAEGTPGVVRVGGRVLDGAGEPVPDALVETWQADPAGRFTPGFGGFGRCATVKPGPLAVPGGGVEAPHLEVLVFARGLLHRLVTRIYFPDEAAANAADPLLASIPDPRLRARLVAVAEEDGLGFDIWLQGERETPFLAL
jgi:protocatechuate 3,4-dioxygenase alpha subunit